MGRKGVAGEARGARKAIDLGSTFVSDIWVSGSAGIFVVVNVVNLVLQKVQQSAGSVSFPAGDVELMSICSPHGGHN